MQPCGEEKHIPKKGPKVIFLIIFPLLGTLLLVLAFLGIFFFLKRKGNGPLTNQINDIHIEEVFSISTFNGKAIYKEIIKSTKGFDAKFCIGTGGFGVVYKAKVTSGHLVAVKKLLPLHDGEIG